MGSAKLICHYNWVEVISQQGHSIQREHFIISCHLFLTIMPKPLSDWKIMVNALPSGLFSALLHFAHHLVVPLGSPLPDSSKSGLESRGWGWGGGGLLSVVEAVGGERAGVLSASTTFGGGSASTTKLSRSSRMLEVVVVVVWPWRCLVILTWAVGGVVRWVVGEGGGFGRQLNGFWEKAGMEMMGKHRWNVSVSLLSHLWILPTPSHPFLFAIKTTKKSLSMVSAGRP